MVESFINKNVDEVKSLLEKNEIKVTVIGDGSRVIKQSIGQGKTVISGDRIILVTNGQSIKMPNIYGWARKEVMILCDLLKIDSTFEGYGYTASQSIVPGTVITDDMILNVILRSDLEE